MEIPLLPWAVCRGALIVLIIRKFFLPSSQNLPCCSLSPLFLVLSTADTKNRLFLSSATAALYVFEDFHHVFLGLLSLRLNKPRCHEPPRCLPTFHGCQRCGTGFAQVASMGETVTASAPSQGGAARSQVWMLFAFLLLEAVTGAVTCGGFPRGRRGGLGRWGCLRAIAMETAGLVSAANRCATSACNQAQELLAKRSAPCADGHAVPWSGCATLSLLSASENPRKTSAVFPISCIQDFSLPSNSPTPTAPFAPHILSSFPPVFTVPSHLPAGLCLPRSHPAPAALLPSADPLVCSSLDCSSDSRVEYPAANVPDRSLPSRHRFVV